MCRLELVLHDALDAFLVVPNRYTLDDLIFGPPNLAACIGLSRWSPHGCSLLVDLAHDQVDHAYLGPLIPTMPTGAGQRMTQRESTLMRSTASWCALCVHDRDGEREGGGARGFDEEHAARHSKPSRGARQAHC